MKIEKKLTSEANAIKAGPGSTTTREGTTWFATSERDSGTIVDIDRG